MPKITMREAISHALMEEMDRDPAVFIMGEEVGVWGGTYAVTKGFYDKYGPQRIKDTPIAENAIKLGLDPNKVHICYQSNEGYQTLLTLVDHDSVILVKTSMKQSFTTFISRLKASQK